MDSVKSHCEEVVAGIVRAGKTDAWILPSLPKDMTGRINFAEAIPLSHIPLRPPLLSVDFVIICSMTLKPNLQ